MSYIRGVSRRQSCLFPAALEEAIAADSIVRVIDAFVDALEVQRLGFEKAQSAATGRPPYDPKDLLKLYIYGYLNQVRASRGLEREAGRNIEVMWLVNQLAPDFKTIADFRKDNAQPIVGVCRAWVLFCREQKLLGGSYVGIDGSKFAAVASRKQVWTQQRIERAVQGIDRDIGEYLKQMDQQDAREAGVDARLDARAVLAALRERREELQALAAQLQDSGERQHVKGESEAKLMRTAQGAHEVAYNVQIAVDDQHDLIVAHAVTNEGNDHGQLEPMAKAAQQVLQAERLTVIADTGYHNGKQAEHCERVGITAIVPAPALVNPTGKDLYTRDQFSYQADEDSYRCPAGETLRRSRTDARAEVYQYSTPACARCALKAQCTRAARRTIVRSFYAEASERMSARAAAQPQLRTRRSSLVEHPFATLKHLLSGAQLLVRGIRKASAEIALCVLGYNLKRTIAVLGIDKVIAALRTRTWQYA